MLFLSFKVEKVESHKLIDQLKVTQLVRTGSWTRILMYSSIKNQVLISSNISAEFLYKYFYNHGMISSVNLGGLVSAPVRVYPVPNIKTLNTKTHASLL